MNIIKRIEKWQKDRNLDKQEFDWLNEATNIVEELLEMGGYSVPKEKRSKLKSKVEKMFSTILVDLDLSFKKTDSSTIADATADIIVFSVGAMLKANVEPECVLDETLKEIESRTGVMVDGKFQKDTSPEAMKKWYKADYNKCKGEKNV